MLGAMTVRNPHDGNFPGGDSLKYERVECMWRRGKFKKEEGGRRREHVLVYGGVRYSRLDRPKVQLLQVPICHIISARLVITTPLQYGVLTTYSSPEFMFRMTANNSFEFHPPWMILRHAAYRTSSSSQCCHTLWLPISLETRTTM